jgi:hypothetical protein
MARSRLTNPTDDLIQDSGSVLWSFVKGEQLEFPITLNFVEDVTAGYQYEAVVVEGANIPDTDEVPITIQTSGIQTKLNVRVPIKRGNWDPAQAYNREEVVYYDGKFYKLNSGIARTSAITPDVDPLWLETSLSRIYLQFPKTLANNWSVSPTVGFPVYGFFELRITEPTDGIFQRTWKPIRGMVQILFSPTEIVPD